MTQEEEEEVQNVVSLLDSVNSKELIDFATQQTEHRHRSISEAELDPLAGKNNAQTTVYQTKWAIAVFKGITNSLLIKIHSRNTLKWSKSTITISNKNLVFECFCN